MTKNFQFLIGFCFLFINSIFCQEYEVGCYTKIDNSSENFAGALKAGDQFGYSVDNIGDINNDGVEDIMVGAFTDDDGGQNRGAVYVLFLNEDDTVKDYQKISDTQGGFTGNLDNEDVFGASVAYLGDLNGDGKPEVAVGAEYDGDGGYWHGAVYILSLNSNGTVAAHTKISDYEGGFTGVLSGEVVFGTDIENIGDLDNDGIQEIAVGSRRDPDGGIETGAVWILFLNNDFTVREHKKISATRGNFSANLQSGDYFGGSVASLGDLDGNGVVDIAVGSYRDDDGGSDFGAFYVLFLNADGSVIKSEKVSATTGGGNFSLNSNAIFARSIDSMSDIDGDGLVEILLGCARCNNPETGAQSGAFFVVELNSDGTVSESYQYAENIGGFTGDLATGDSFGISVAFVSNSDPLKVVAGAQKDGEGAVWIMNFSENLSDVEIEASTPDCGSENGALIFSNLGANHEYGINYTRNGSLQSTGNISSNSVGELIIPDLPEGEYSEFFITKGACTFNYDELFDLRSTETLEVDFESFDTSGCSMEDGSIVIFGLAEDSSYEFEYSFNGNSQTAGIVNSDSNGKIILNSLPAGNYSEFAIISNGCIHSYDNEVQINSPQSPEAEITTSNPDSCSATNGSVSITQLEPDVTYNLMYDYNSEVIVVEDLVADASGTITIEGLASGNYNNLELLYDGCEIFLEETITLGAAEGAIVLLQIIDPNDCGNANGSVSFEGLDPDTAYSVETLFNGGNLQLNSLTSNEDGVLAIDGLETGEYTQVKILNGPCSYTAPDFLLNCETPEEEVCYTYPLFFTPNGDGVHDNWKIELSNVTCNSNFECYIFDRYGKLLKVLKGPNESWDGTFNNRAMPSDDYWIRIEFPEDLGEEVKKANISLIR
ncbi:T9SS type B sorting domain-containing protein [Salegentibacter sp. F188]|uniref:T9SS type B sorting domain-containing protein n=1 Tax=Autumnicola patrickiae TaxID=3075591 RepID=A0ABU3E1S1_9FLAO|nr:T9SS type B sorting domain-containing protein [Salegentibacter sp. F188]MDT0689217.1 T9SS type B sorting domain-containing protein [Salegentibacter sp. F188]